MTNSISHAEELSSAETEAGNIIGESHSDAGDGISQSQDESGEPKHRIVWGGQQDSGARALPGCRSCDFDSSMRTFELSVTEYATYLAATLTIGGLHRSWNLTKEDGAVMCNLQELTMLRWLVEAHDDATKPSWSSRVRYKPTRRYQCCAPHLKDTFHDVEEALPTMEEQELQVVADEARRKPSILLCPARTLTYKCNDYSEGVKKKLLKLASLIPVRQVFSGPPVAGMLDIVPVSTCFPTGDRRADHCCVGKDRIGGSQTVLEGIWTHKKFGKGDMNWTRERLDDFNNDLRMAWAGIGLEMEPVNDELAIHSSWLNSPSAQPAVLDVKKRRAIASLYPTRLYDTEDAMAKEGLQPDCYLALSYCWAEWDDHALKDRLAQLAQQLGIQYFWVDRWCVKQDDTADKEREIPRMKDYYRGASACVVLLAPGPTPKFQCLPQQNGAILSGLQQMRLNWDGMNAIVTSKWVSRVWTLQETLMSRQVIYSIDDQLIDGDFVSQIQVYDGMVRAGCYRWDLKDPFVIPPQHVITGDGGVRPTISRSVYGGEIQYNNMSRANGEVKMPLEEALMMVHGRSATVREDYVYGVLGMTDGGEKVTVRYPRTWEDILHELVGLGLITDRQLATPTVNQIPGKSWLPHCTEGSSYGPFLEGEPLAAVVDRPKLTWSERGVLVRAAKFKWMHNDFEKPVWPTFTNSIHDMPCYSVRCVLEVEGNLLLGSLTSSRPFTNERLSGTHMLLCDNFDSFGRLTIVVKLSNDSGAAESFHREDGYILEVHKFVTRDTGSVPREAHGFIDAPWPELQGEHIWIR